MIAARAAIVLARALRGLSQALLRVGDLATPVLLAARCCEDRAREWDPRLWERDGDPRADTRERRP